MYLLLATDGLWESVPMETVEANVSEQAIEEPKQVLDDNEAREQKSQIVESVLVSTTTEIVEVGPKVDSVETVEEPTEPLQVTAVSFSTVPSEFVVGLERLVDMLQQVTRALQTSTLTGPKYQRLPAQDEQLKV